MGVMSIPDGNYSVTPHLIIKGAAAAIKFYQTASDAVEVMRFTEPGGKIGRADIRIGDSIIKLGDEYPDMDYRGPDSLGGTTASLLLFVEDVGARFQQAIAAGEKELRPVVDRLYVDRSGTIGDPFGHHWMIATHKEDLTPDEMPRRAAASLPQTG